MSSHFKHISKSQSKVEEKIHVKYLKIDSQLENILHGQWVYFEYELGLI